MRREKTKTPQLFGDTEELRCSYHQIVPSEGIRKIRVKNYHRRNYFITLNQRESLVKS